MVGRAEGGAVAVVAVGRGEPAGPGRDVDGGRDQRRTRPAATWRRCAARPASRAGNPAARRAPRSQARTRAPKASDVPDAVPLAGDRGAQAQARGRPAASGSPAAGRAGPARPSRAGSSGVGRGGQPGPGPVPVDDQQAEGGQHPEHDEDVEDRGPAQHELQAVQRHQQPGDAAEQGRAGHPADDPGQHQDGQRADQRDREPPAERGQPEQPLADRDHHLAERRVRDQLALGAGQDVRAARDEQRRWRS